MVENKKRVRCPHCSQCAKKLKLDMSGLQMWQCKKRHIFTFVDGRPIVAAS